MLAVQLRVTCPPELSYPSLQSLLCWRRRSRLRRPLHLPHYGPVSAAVQEAAEQEPSGSYPWWRYVPSQQLLDWKAVDKEGVTTEGADAPQGFCLEDVDGETASSTRE